MGRKPHRRGPRKRDIDRAAEAAEELTDHLIGERGVLDSKLVPTPPMIGMTATPWRLSHTYTTQQVERHDPTRGPGSLVLDFPAEYKEDTP